MPLISPTLVIGAGFSGLSAAICLARAGVDVTLVERAAEFSMDGAGISIGGPTLRSLAALGVLDRFFELGYGADGTDMLGPDGTQLAQFPTPRLVSPDTPGNGAIMRPLLGRILADAALEAGVAVRFGTAVTGIEPLHDAGGRDGARVTFEGGATEEYGLVVAADGLYSRTRAELLPHAPSPAFSGQGAWRAVVPRPASIERTTIWVGGPAKLGVNPISHEQMYVFVNEPREENGRVPDEELLPRLRSLLSPIPAPAVQSIAESLTEDALVMYRPMDNLLVPLPWHSGRVVFIGDAVHATTPHLAAGAGIGIEDGLVLAEELAAHNTVEDGIAAFERRRFERCALVVRNSERLGELESRPGTQAEFGELQAASMRALAEAI